MKRQERRKSEEERRKKRREERTEEEQTEDRRMRGPAQDRAGQPGRGRGTTSCGTAGWLAHGAAWSLSTSRPAVEHGPSAKQE